MRNDAINMEVNEGLLAFGAEEEVAVGADAVAGEVDPGGGVEGGGEGIGLNPFVHFVHRWAERSRWTTVRGFFV